MGTRSIVCIYRNGRFVAAQTGRADGHPEVTGLAILHWLVVEGNIQRLLQKIHLVQPPPYHDENYQNSFISIKSIATSTSPIKHVCKLDFASEGLWCAWAYVVDLDVGTLKVYQGDNRFRGPMEGRFAEAGVVQQVLKATFAFADLPGFEDEFVQACYPGNGPTMPGGWRLPQAPLEIERDVLCQEARFVGRDAERALLPVAFNDVDGGGDNTEREEDTNDEIDSGTRHLIYIYHNGTFVVAQYGAWDGYPEIAGLAVRRFLTADNIQRLRERIHLVPPPVPRNVDRHGRAFHILREIASARRTVKHSLQLGFASNGEMCAWCYVVDLDAGALEIYRGRSAGRIPRRHPPYRSVGVVGAGRFADVGVVQQELQAIFSFGDSLVDEDAFMAACGGVRGEDGYFDWSL